MSEYEQVQSAYQIEAEAEWGRQQEDYAQQITWGETKLEAIQEQAHNQITDTRENWQAENKATLNDYRLKSTQIRTTGEQHVEQTVTNERKPNAACSRRQRPWGTRQQKV